jgi:hypothetical protein
MIESVDFGCKYLLASMGALDAGTAHLGLHSKSCL